MNKEKVICHSSRISPPAHCEVTRGCGVEISFQVYCQAGYPRGHCTERLKDKIKMLKSHGLLHQFKMQSKKLEERERVD